MEIAYVVLVVLAAGVYAVWRWQADQQRREEWHRVAHSLGLSYKRHDRRILDLPFPLFRKGDGNGTENVAYGEWNDLDVKVFDYWYYEESNDAKGRRSKTYHRFSCAITEIPASCPGASITEETLLSRMADAVGLRDIEFESEAFNRAFQVRCRDRKFASDLIDPRMMEHLLYITNRWRFELVDRWVLCYTSRIRPGEVHSILGVVKGFRDHIPRVVWELYGTDDEAASGR